MQKLKLKIMDNTGDKQVDYDPKDKAKVKEVMDMIKEKLKKGYTLYGAKVGGEMEQIANQADLDEKKLPKTLEELDRFMLAPGKKLLAAPLTSG